MQESQKVIQKHLGMDGGDSMLPNELCGHIPEAGSTQALMKCCVCGLHKENGIHPKLLWESNWQWCIL